MDTQHFSAPPHAQTRVAGNNRPPRQPRFGGLVHDNTRHTARFTVVGNHLAQHRKMSLTAIGLALHIQSLPKGAQVDIKTLAARFPEGATRIAAALRELEDHGYLRRPRERVCGGHMVTRTISCNQPGRHTADAADAADAAHPDHGTDHGTDHGAESGADHGADPGTDHGSESGTDHGTESEAAPGPVRHQGDPTPKKREKREKRAPRKPLPAVPRPAHAAPALLQAATDLLADLRRHDPCLLLSVCDTAHLAPGVAAWLERDVSPSAVRQALIADLPPEGVRRPAALLAHRLTAQLPPPPPFRAPAPPPAAVRHPLQTCDGCDRAFRAPEPGRCRDCRCDHPGAA